MRGHQLESTETCREKGRFLEPQTMTERRRES